VDYLLWKKGEKEIINFKKSIPRETQYFYIWIFSVWLKNRCVEFSWKAEGRERRQSWREIGQEREERRDGWRGPSVFVLGWEAAAPPWLPLRCAWYGTGEERRKLKKREGEGEKKGENIDHILDLTLFLDVDGSTPFIGDVVNFDRFQLSFSVSVSFSLSFPLSYSLFSTLFFFFLPLSPSLSPQRRVWWVRQACSHSVPLSLPLHPPSLSLPPLSSLFFCGHCGADKHVVRSKGSATLHEGEEKRSHFPAIPIQRLCRWRADDFIQPNQKPFLFFFFFLFLVDLFLISWHIPQSSFLFLLFLLFCLLLLLLLLLHDDGEDALLSWLLLHHWRALLSLLFFYFFFLFHSFLSHIQP
jgi:hypothetical protein